MKYFITVEYRIYIAPKIGESWENNADSQTCNGVIFQHPLRWLEEQYKRQQEAWDADESHTRFGILLFYAPLEDEINTDEWQDLS